MKGGNERNSSFHELSCVVRKKKVPSLFPKLKWWSKPIWPPAVQRHQRNEMPTLPNGQRMSMEEFNKEKEVGR